MQRKSKLRRGVNLFTRIPLQRRIFSHYQIGLLSATGRNSHFAGAETTVGHGVENQNILFFSTEAEIPLRVGFVLPECSCSEYAELSQLLHTHTPGRGYAKSKSSYFSTRRYRNPPLLRSPNFLNPLNWGGHLIGTGM